MATQTTDQQNALKDAMARAKMIAAKLQQQQHTAPAANSDDDTRKRGFSDAGSGFTTEPPMVKQSRFDAVDHTDPKIIAQQVANSLVQRAGLGSMLVEEVYVPNKLVGLVIGRGGEMINKLQSESGAKIQVAPDPPPEMAMIQQDRQVTVTGTSESVNKAKALIEQIKNEGKVPEKLLMGPSAPGEYSIEMMIVGNKIGLVIGKGGETIKSLQERAGCKMVLFQEGEYAHAPEKPLRISGEQSKVQYGKQLVSDLLTMKELESINPEKQQQQQNHGGSYDEVQVPREAVGFVIGAKGASINNLQQMTGCRVQFKSKNDYDMEGEFKIATLSGTPQQVANAKAKLNELISSHSNRGPGGSGGPPSLMGGHHGGPGGSGPMPNRNWSPNNGPRPAWGGGGNFNNGPRGGWNGPGHGGPRGGGGWNGPRGPHGGGRGGPPPPLPPGHKHMEIRVPANKCGLVIGKGGETLKYIHSQTKVNIEINRELPNDLPIRVFHVRGTEEQIEKATEIIREKIGDQSISPEEPQENGGGGGGRGGHGAPNQQWGGPNNQWGGPNQQNNQWGGQPNNQWGGPQGGPQQGNWNGPQSGGPDTQGAWNQGAWNQGGQQPPQQQPTWNQATGQWDQPQQQPWQQPNAQQWAAQYGQWGQQPTSSDTTTTPTPTNPTTPQSAADPSQTTATSTATSQPDYSAAWALYYQQQNQYYQQYGGAPPAAGGAAAPAAGTPTSDPQQAQSVADYQAKMAEYYKSFGQQPQQ